MRNLPVSLVALALSGCVPVDGSAVGSVEEGVSVWQWTDDVKIDSQASSYQVGLASYGSKMYMVSTRASSTTLEMSTWNAGVGWSPALSLSQWADYGPAVSVLDGRPLVVYHAAGQNRLLMSFFYESGLYDQPTTAGTSLGQSELRYAPAATVWNGKLHVAYCKRTGGLDRVQIDRYDASTWTWSAVRTIDYGLELTEQDCKGVALSVRPDGRLDLVYNVESTADGDDWPMYEVLASATSQTWVSQKLPMKSKKPPSLVSCHGLMHLTHGGFSTPSEIWWTAIDGGISWIGDARVPNQNSDGGAALVCEQGYTAAMVHNGGYPQLWWSKFGP